MSKIIIIEQDAPSVVEVSTPGPQGPAWPSEGVKAASEAARDAAQAAAQAAAASSASAGGYRDAAGDSAAAAEVASTNAATSAGTANTKASQAAASAAAAADSATAAAADRTQTGLDRVQTGLDRAATGQDVATATTQAGIATTQANNAAASFDSFDDRYLGAKSAAPSVDNDGAALLTGALYWDTALAALRVWTGSAWTNTTELDDRVLADQQLLGAAAYATDMALQAVRELLRVEPKFDASIAALSATVLTYDTALEQMLNALAHLLDLSGVTARAISGGNVIVGAGTATNPSLTPFADPDTGLFFPAPNESALATGGVERVRLDANGRMGIGTTTPTSLLDVADDRLRIRTAKTPASAGAAGNAGEVCWDGSYVYICTATNTWRRAAIAAW